MGEREDIKDLHDRIINLITEVTLIEEKKNEVDQILERSVSKEKNHKYEIVDRQISIMKDNFDKLITKYQKFTGWSPDSPLPKLELSTAKGIIDEFHKTKAKLMTPNFFRLAELSREFDKLKKNVSQFLDRVNPGNLIVEKKPEVVQVQHIDDHLPQDKYVKKLLDYLFDPEVKRIGIVGPVGVGKSTILKKFNNKLEDMASPSNVNSRLRLDIVIWTTFPENLPKDEIIEKIQDNIIERLKLHQEKPNSINLKEATISGFLRDKKYVVLMDEVPYLIDLNKVGLHEEHMYGKVVIASRTKKAADFKYKVVEIEYLPADEAFKLFQNIYGEMENDWKKKAWRIVECCGGLPQVIFVVARYLQDTNSSWDDVKRILQCDTEPSGLLNLDVVEHAYKAAYDGLHDDKMKKCLLYGALFPSEHIIPKDYLMECWMAERFIFVKDRRILNATRARGLTVLKELTDKYLLDRWSDKHVKMPKFCRKVALKQKFPGEENGDTWVPLNNGDDGTPNQEDWMKAKRMSLISCKPSLPEAPQSLNMSTLLLQRNQELVTIGASFFNNMNRLRVLDLYEAGIESLPGSISNLANLASLYLNNCSQLNRLPAEVKELKNLEFLDIRGTSISSLPDEIGEMNLLRCLRVSFAQKRCSCSSNGNNREILIPLNIISRLQQLEELSIEMGCCSQGRRYDADKIADELAHLEKLSTLTFHFPSVCILKRFISDNKSWKNTVASEENALSSFKIFIGCSETQHPHGSDISGILAERQLRFSSNGCSLNEEISSVNEVLGQVKAFELVGHSSVESLSKFDLEKTRSLGVCIVECCKNMLSVVDAAKINEMGMEIQADSAGAVLECLEKLHLYDLESLQSIWKGSVFTGSLSKLKVLTLSRCPQLTEILNLELAKALSSLNHLKVENCSEIVDIVKVDIDFDLSDTLDKLETITLVDLPQLQSICRSNSMNWNSLTEIVIRNCSKLKNMSLSNAGKLQKVYCETRWWSELSEEEKQFFPHHDFKVEQRLTIGGSHEGESSNNGRSDNPQASDNNIDLQTSNVENRPEEIMSSSGISNETLASNTSSIDGAHRPEEVTPLPERSLASTVDYVRRAETLKENPEVTSQFKVECLTFPSSIIDAPARNETDTFSGECSVQNGSVNIHSSVSSFSDTNQSPATESSSDNIAEADEQ